jgi:hypothetical protein
MLFRLVGRDLLELANIAAGPVRVAQGRFRQNPGPLHPSTPVDLAKSFAFPFHYCDADGRWQNARDCGLVLGCIT